jgi:pyruvate formate-lyase activating enzyme-like uncharacterized protein
MNKKHFFDKLNLMNPTRLSPDDQFILREIERRVEEKFIGHIRKRQAKIDGLETDDLGYVAYLGYDFPQTCDACLNHDRGIQVIRNSFKCQLDCKFCYYYGETPQKEHEGMVWVQGRWHEPRDVKLLFKDHGRDKTIRWLHYEPLLETTNMFPLMEWFSENGFYQSLNTNGILATESMLERLAAAGLNDLRFNPAATLCSKNVLNNMTTARNYFNSVGIESPMFHQFKKALLDNKDQILDAVDYIAFQELQVGPKNMGKMYGPYYRYHMGKMATLSSRELVYDIFEIAVDEDWDVFLLDCSNELKFYRDITQGNFLGDTGNWTSRVNWLPFDWYFQAVSEL